MKKQRGEVVSIILSMFVAAVLATLALGGSSKPIPECTLELYNAGQCSSSDTSVYGGGEGAAE